ncbi:hypothetical protein GCM10027579_22940 [Calidifontibacter terrae]
MRRTVARGNRRFTSATASSVALFSRLTVNLRVWGSISADTTLNVSAVFSGSWLATSDAVDDTVISTFRTATWDATALGTEAGFTVSKTGVPILSSSEKSASGMLELADKLSMVSVDEI